MPATFPSHAAAALPFKLARPAWFDGVALVVGSTAPDLSYPLSPFGLLLFTHQWLSLLWWSLPVTVVLSTIVRWSAPAVAAHLPADRWFALRDYGVLGRAWPRWWITVTSALVGAATHLFWDGFTHPPEGGWFVRAHPVMTHIGPLGLPWWSFTQYVSSVVGGLITLALFLAIGRQRLIRRWHGPPPVIRTNPALFWTVAAGLACTCAAATLADPQGLYIQAVRLMLGWSAALVAAACLSQLLPASRPGEARGIPQDQLRGSRQDQG
jgi:hypothetical protein